MMMQKKMCGVKNNNNPNPHVVFLLYNYDYYDYYVFNNFNIIAHKSEFESHNWDFLKIHNRLYICFYLSNFMS